MPFPGHLDPGTLRLVGAALVELRLVTEKDFRALTRRMPPAYVEKLDVGRGQRRLGSALRRLNRTKVLASGVVPLTIWLRNAIRQAEGRPQEMVFRRALERMSSDGRAPADPARDRPGPAAMLGPPTGALEVAIGEDDTIEVAYLTRGVAAARSVTKLLVHRHFDGRPSTIAGGDPDLGKGTGWLIAPGLLVTNHHVVNGRTPREPPASEEDFALQGANTHVQFDFLDEQSPLLLAQAEACVASDEDLDFALLRLAATAPARMPLRLRMQPILKPKERELRERVNVLQHPDGRPMRLGFRNNFVVNGTDDRLSYLTDTAGGASGSPICDDKWFVAALHRGWQTIEGEPVMVWGLPVKQENYGTPVSAILAFLADRHPDLHAEVVAGQAALPAE